MHCKKTDSAQPWDSPETKTQDIFGQCMTRTENDPFAKQCSEVWDQGLVQAQGLPHFPCETRFIFMRGIKGRVAKKSESASRHIMSGKE